jgi:hypothetical protein
MGCESVKIIDDHLSPDSYFYGISEKIRQHVRGNKDCGFWQHDYTWVGYGDTKKRLP